MTTLLLAVNPRAERSLYCFSEQCIDCSHRKHRTVNTIIKEDGWLDLSTNIREKGTKPDTPGWDVRVVPNISPILRIEGQLDRIGRGTCDIMNGIGAHEMIIETPKHINSIAELSLEQIEKIIKTYIERITDLGKDTRFKYVLLFKNHGMAAGAGTVNHARSWLMAMPVNPKRVKEKLNGAKRYFEYKERCIFCDMIKQEIEMDKRVAIDSDGFVVIAPFASRFPFELTILPKRHSPDFISLKSNEISELAKVLKLCLSKLITALNDPPYNIILHTAPFRRTTRAGYWKTIDEDFHWHLEIMPRLTRVAGFEWGTGFYINPTPPEEAAKYLRETEVQT